MPEETHTPHLREAVAVFTHESKRRFGPALLRDFRSTGFQLLFLAGFRLFVLSGHVPGHKRGCKCAGCH